MKFLLVGINAKYIHSNPAILCLEEYAKKYIDDKRFEIETVEYTINMREEEVLSDIYKKNADFVGFSVYIWNASMTFHIVSNLKKICPKTEVWLGGPEVSYNPKEVLTKLPGVTGIMVGEGEKTFTELVKMYLSKEDVSAADIETGKVEGTVYRYKDSIVTSGVRECIDLSDVPFIYEDLEEFDGRIVYYESSRGCPFKCAYCLSSVDKSLRLRDMAIVKKELKTFLDKKVSLVKFVDRTFNCQRARTIELLQFLRDNDNGVTTFHFEIAGDILSDEECELLMSLRPGLVKLEIGVQSTNEETLRSINRVTDMEKLRKNATKLIQAGNIHIHLDLIAGLMYEDYESFKKSFNDVYSLRPNELQLGFLKVLTGTKIAETSDEYGIVFDSNPPYEVLETKWITYSEISELKEAEEVLEIYFNSAQFVNSVKFLEQYENTPFEMYANIAEFYRECGYGFMQSSRAKKYEILLAYVTKYHSEILSRFKDYLVMDYYLREKPKSRPEFAGDYDFERMKELYSKENVEKYLPSYSDRDVKSIQRMTHCEEFKTLGETWFFDYSEKNPITGECLTIKIG